MLSSSFVRFPVCRFPVGTDKQRWRDRRKQTIGLLRCSTASTLSSFFGHSYTSFHNALLELKTEKRPDIFTAKAMSHGEKTEDEAKNAYLWVDTEVTVLCSGEESTVHGFLKAGHSEEFPAFIMTTPDMIVKRGKHKEIVEFKCPYFEIFTKKLRKERTIERIVLDFYQKHPMGVESSFLQASIYALCEPEVTIVNVVYYFTDGTDNAGMIIYTYDTSQVFEFDEMIISAAARVSHEMQSDDRPRTKTHDKRKLTQSMCNAFYVHSIYHKDENNEWVRLNEETTDHSEEDGPEVPRE